MTRLVVSNSHTEAQAESDELISQVENSIYMLCSLIAQHETGDLDTLKTLEHHCNELYEAVQESNLQQLGTLLNNLCLALKSKDPSSIRLNRLELERLGAILYDGLLQRKIHLRISPSRITLLNAIASKRGYSRYLEIGCRDDSCFSKILCAEKIGVDPLSGGTLRMTSDEFFKGNQTNFDLIFIDGLHEAKQVASDISNSLCRLNPGGTIVVHDCLPRYEVSQVVPLISDVWNGDIWRAFLAARSLPGTESFTADLDHGCGIVRVTSPHELDSGKIKSLSPTALEWKDLLAERKKLMNILSYEEVLAKI